MMGLAKKPPNGKASLPILQVIDLHPHGSRTFSGRKMRHDIEEKEGPAQSMPARYFLGLSPKSRGLILLNLVRMVLMHRCIFIARGCLQD